MSRQSRSKLLSRRLIIFLIVVILFALLMQVYSGERGKSQGLLDKVEITRMNFVVLIGSIFIIGGISICFEFIRPLVANGLIPRTGEGPEGEEGEGKEGVEPVDEELEKFQKEFDLHTLYDEDPLLFELILFLYTLKLHELKAFGKAILEKWNALKGGSALAEVSRKITLQPLELLPLAKTYVQAYRYIIKAICDFRDAMKMLVFLDFFFNIAVDLLGGGGPNFLDFLKIFAKLRNLTNLVERIEQIQSIKSKTDKVQKIRKLHKDLQDKDSKLLKVSSADAIKPESSSGKPSFAGVIRGFFASPVAVLRGCSPIAIIITSIAFLGCLSIVLYAIFGGGFRRNGVAIEPTQVIEESSPAIATEPSGEEQSQLTPVETPAFSWIFFDPINDLGSCSTGIPFNESIGSSIDIEQIRVEYYPGSDEITLIMRVSELEAADVLEGDRRVSRSVYDGPTLYAGGFLLSPSGSSSYADPTWLANNFADTSLNFFDFGNGTMQFEAVENRGIEEGWVEEPESVIKADLNVEDNEILITFSRPWAVNQGLLDPSTGDFFIVASAFDIDQGACDFAGIGLDGTPYINLSIDPSLASSAVEPLPQFNIYGRFDITFNVILDRTSHEAFMKFPKNLEIEVKPGSLRIEGPPPWVNIKGDFDPEDGSFFATGSGTVAGFSDIVVTYEGTLLENGISGNLTMGAEGGLPGGEPIVYFAAGNKVENLDEEITPEETPSGLSVDYRSAVETFVNQFNMAFQEEDVGILYGLLDPTVIDLYGADVCQTYLSTVIKNTTQLELVEVLNVGAWIWEIDGLSIQLSNIYKAIVNFTVQGNTTQESFHLSLAEDGSMRWFTDCGDPQAQ